MEAADKAGGKGPDEAAKAPVSAPPPAAVEDDAPDPDEDDLDDLDDMLDDFSHVKLDATKKPPQPGAAAPPKAAAGSAVPPLDPDVPGADDDDDFDEEEFQKQLKAGMAELMGDMETTPEMQAQFENIFKGLGEAMGAGEGASSAGAAAGGASASPGPEAKKAAGKAAADLSQDASFQDTIKRTMARMQESGDQATKAAAEGGEDDFIAEMMKAMGDLPGGEGGGAGGEEDFSKMLMGMMEQLTNKEILYEPMKELSDKFPGWMREHAAGLSAEDRDRYTTQQTLATEMVARFEQPSYSDSNPADREYILDRMQKMQAAGSPPTDLVGDMPSAKEVLDGPDPDESCPQQ